MAASEASAISGELSLVFILSQGRNWLRCWPDRLAKQAFAALASVGDTGGMTKRITQLARQASPPSISIRPFYRFLPDWGIEDLREEAMNAFLFHSLCAGRSPLDRPWLKIPCTLFKAAEKGKLDCAKAIVELACQAAQWVSSLEGSNPKMMSAIARTRAIWPVLGSYDPSWDKGISERLTKLGLGQDSREVLPIFREAQGDDDKLSARRWAREAVRCVLFTRGMQRKLSQLEKRAKDNLRQRKLQIEAAPVWAQKAKDLPDYSAENRPVWGKFIRGVIRQQFPDFHLCHEWKNHRNSCKTSNLKGKASKSDIQNAILDDIAAALKTITVKEVNAASV